MRLVLLPISTKRTLLYCIRTTTAAPRTPNVADRVTAKVAGVWAGWERRESGWQRRVTDYGNSALRRVPYQEWGLKSVPPLSARRRADVLAGREPVELTFPGAVIKPSEAEGILRKLGTEREAHHRMRLIWCFVGMPISAPVALVPVIPNLPFFYLAYRAWSHWRALKGSQHVQFLVKNKIPTLTPSPILDAIYATPRTPTEPPPTPESEKTPGDEGSEAEEEPLLTSEEEILINPEIGKKLSEALEHPEIEVELERALWQVNQQRERERAAAKGR